MRLEVHFKKSRSTIACVSMSGQRQYNIPWLRIEINEMMWLYRRRTCYCDTLLFLRRIQRYQRGKQNPYTEEEQTTQWPRGKVQKDKQRSTKHTHKTKDRATRSPLKTESCSERLSSSCSTSCTRRVNLVTNPVISHEWGKDREVLTTSRTYPWLLWLNNWMYIDWLVIYIHRVYVQNVDINVRILFYLYTIYLSWILHIEVSPDIQNIGLRFTNIYLDSLPMCQLSIVIVKQLLCSGISIKQRTRATK